MLVTAGDTQQKSQQKAREGNTSQQKDVSARGARELVILTMLARAERRKESLQVARTRNVRRLVPKEEVVSTTPSEHTKWLLMRTCEAPRKA